MRVKNPHCGHKHDHHDELLSCQNAEDHILSKCRVQNAKINFGLKEDECSLALWKYYVIDMLPTKIICVSGICV